MFALHALPYSAAKAAGMLQVTQPRRTLPLHTVCHCSKPVILPLQERSVPAEVLELPQKGDRIIHFAWEPHVSYLVLLSCL